MRILPSRPIGTVQALQLFQAIRYGTQILVAVLLVKGRLPQADIGQFETFLLIAGAVSFFWVSGILKGLLATYPGVEPQDRGSYFTSSFLLLATVNLIVLATVFFARSALSGLAGIGSFEYWPALLLYLLLLNPTHMTEHLYLLLDKGRSIVAYGLTVFTLQLAAVALPLFLGYGLNGILEGLIALAALRMLWLLVALNRFGTWTWQGKHQRALWLAGWPLLLSMLISGSAEYIDGFIIRSYFDDADFSIFRYGAREFPLAIVLANAFSVATIPMIAADWRQGLTEIRERSARLMNLLFPMTILLLLISKPLFRLAFSPEFEFSATIFNIYLLLIISRLLFPQTLLTGTGKTQPLVRSAALELTLNLGLSLLLVKPFGMQGVAFATLFAFCADKLYLMMAVRRTLGVRWSEYVPVKRFALYSAVTVAAYLFASCLL